jgi:hypothetical protein
MAYKKVYNLFLLVIACIISNGCAVKKCEVYNRAGVAKYSFYKKNVVKYRYKTYALNGYGSVDKYNCNYVRKNENVLVVIDDTLKVTDTIVFWTKKEVELLHSYKYSKEYYKKHNLRPI